MILSDTNPAGALSRVAWRLVLAAPPTPGAPGAPPGSERGEEFGKTSPLALVVILLLGLATVLLVRSMTKRLRKVPASFGEPDTSDDPASRRPGLGPDVERLDATESVDPPDKGPRAGPTGSP